MALIICPECGKQVSDKAVTCPNCGYPILKDGKDNIVETAFALEEEKLEEIVQNDPGVNNKSKTKLIIIAIVSVIVIAGIIITALYGNLIRAKIAYKNEDYAKTVELLDKCKELNDDSEKMRSISNAFLAYRNKDYAKVINLLQHLDLSDNEAANAIYVDAEAKLREAYLEQILNYKEALTQFGEEHTKCDKAAVLAASNIIAVWNNSIWKIKNDETDKYTRQNNGQGSFYNDFNDALTQLASSMEYIEWQIDMELGRQGMYELLEDLKNPPSYFSGAYEYIKACYDDMDKLVDFLLNPSGTYLTFVNQCTVLMNERKESAEDFEAYLTKLLNQ